MEQIWWLAFGHFDNLHPEYEISDFRDGNRFMDFAFLRNPVRLGVEIDGYGPHLFKLSRSQFSDQLIRQNHLIIDGWKILRFSYDDVKERPRMCVQLIQQFMGRWFNGNVRNTGSLTPVEKEILHLAIRLDRILTPKNVCTLLNVEEQKARILLHGLLNRGLLMPGGRGTERIRSYQLTRFLNPDDLGM